MPVVPSLITFLSDYGLRDDFVGVCHGVIARVNPEARVIDLTHGIDRHDVRGGAFALARALPYLPAGVHLAVVDPDVGAGRRAIALELADGRRLVGPDNGLLWPAAEAGGGVLEAAEITHSPYRLQPVSATFHGRDLFAPVAATLSLGTALARTGRPCDPAALVRLELPRARPQADGLLAEVTAVDGFGNAQLGANHEALEGLGFRLGHLVEMTLADRSTVTARYVRTFADGCPGETIVYEDAYRALAIAISHGDAAQTLGLRVGAELRLQAA
ncbi:MAG: SAM hydrolase/SAM-dependent halogenase family protein [Solirubrobacteraceae bacterium]